MKNARQCLHAVEWRTFTNSSDNASLLEQTSLLQLLINARSVSAEDISRHRDVKCTQQAYVLSTIYMVPPPHQKK